MKPSEPKPFGKFRPHGAAHGGRADGASDQHRGGGRASAVQPQVLTLGEHSADVAYLCVGRDDIDDQLRQLGILHAPIVGFDVERRPAFAKNQHFPTAVLQLSTLSKCAVISLGRGQISRELAILIRSADVLKVGVGIQQDLSELCKDMPKALGHEVGAFVDLSLLALLTGHARVEDDPRGLKRLAEAFGASVEKSRSVQLSRWDAVPLSARQIRYAAMDAFASRWLATKLLGPAADAVLAAAVQPYANMPCSLKAIAQHGAWLDALPGDAHAVVATIRRVLEERKAKRAAADAMHPRRLKPKAKAKTKRRRASRAKPTQQAPPP